MQFVLFEQTSTDVSIETEGKVIVYYTNSLNDIV